MYHRRICKPCRAEDARIRYAGRIDRRQTDGNRDRRGRPAVRPVIETWWERWNRECGTRLTAADAERLARKVAVQGRGAVSRARGVSHAV